MPSLSIIVPVFNRPGLLRDTLESIREQTYRGWECILADDGSDREALGVQETFCNADGRFRMVQRGRPPRGASTCRNIGKEAAKGTYLLFLDSDDLLAPWCLEARVKEMESHPDADVGLFQGVAFQKNPLDTARYANKFQAGTKGEDLLALYLKKEINWHTTAPLWRRSFVETIVWDEAATHWQDREFHITALMHHPRVFVSGALPDYFKRSAPDVAGISSGNYQLDRLENRVALYGRIYQELPDRYRPLFSRVVSREARRWTTLHSVRGRAAYRKLMEILQPLKSSMDIPTGPMRAMGGILALLGNWKVPLLRGVLVRLWIGPGKKEGSGTGNLPVKEVERLRERLHDGHLGSVTRERDL